MTVNEGDPPVTVDKSSVEEGEPASFVVELSGAVQKTVEVSYATSDGTGNDAATAGTDYTAADVTLTFASKETTKTVAVTTTEDTDNEADETFTVTLTGVTLPDGVSLDASATTATGTIENDDALTATVKANAENVTEGNAAGFTVELTGGTSTADVEVTYTWASTGTAGTDYTAPNGLLTIATPDSSGTISIATLTDDVLDPGETLSVTLTDATTATGTATVGTPATATTTIAQEGTVTVSVRKDEVLDDDTTPGCRRVRRQVDRGGRWVRQLHSGVVRGRGERCRSVLRDLRRHRGGWNQPGRGRQGLSAGERYAHLQIRRVPYPDHRGDHHQ